MKKISIIILIFLLNYSCRRDTVDIEFHSIIQNAYLKHEKCFAINGLSLKWDSLMFLHPYTDPAKFKVFDAHDLKRINKSGIKLRDDIYVIVFCFQGNVVQILEAPMSIYDFSKLKFGYFYPESTLFSLSSEKTQSIYMLIECYE